MTLVRPPDARPLDAAIPGEVVDAFTSAVTTALEELTQTAASVGDSFLSGMEVGGDVVAAIVLRKKAPGKLTLAFPQPMLETLARRYLSESAELTQAIVDDLAGEFANVIAGQAKTMLKGTPYHFLLSTPVVSRLACEWRASDGPTAWVQVFATDIGSFLLQVRLQPGED